VVRTERGPGAKAGEVEGWALYNVKHPADWVKDEVTQGHGVLKGPAGEEGSKCGREPLVGARFGNRNTGGATPRNGVGSS